MAELYEPLVGFNLWISRDGEDKAQLEFVTKQLLLPKSNKIYKLTLKNLKVYIEERMNLDPSISEIQIDRINSVGIIKR